MDGELSHSDDGGKVVPPPADRQFDICALKMSSFAWRTTTTTLSSGGVIKKGSRFNQEAEEGEARGDEASAQEWVITSPWTHAYIEIKAEEPLKYVYLTKGWEGT